MSIEIKDLKKNEELDREAAMRFYRGGKKRIQDGMDQTSATDKVKSRLLKSCDSESAELE